jgi:hypothetical protein
MLISTPVFLKKHFRIWSLLWFISGGTCSLLRLSRHDSPKGYQKWIPEWQMSPHVLFREKWREMILCWYRIGKTMYMSWSNTSSIVGEICSNAGEVWFEKLSNNSRCLLA